MTPEALWAMGRIGGVQPSPDGSKILYNVSYYSVAENKSHTVICLMNADGSDVKTLTKSAKSQAGAVWTPDGKIAYISGEDGTSSLWIMNEDGSAPRKITGFDKDVEGFRISPDGKKAVLIAQIPWTGATILGNV